MEAEAGAEVVACKWERSDALNALQTQFLRRAMRCGTYTANAFLHGEAGLRTITITAMNLHCMFGHLSSMCHSDRVLSAVSRARLDQTLAGGAARKWCRSMRAVFERYDSLQYHTGEKDMPSQDQWIELCRIRTLQHSNEQWRKEVQSKSTLSTLYSVTLKW